MAIGIPSLAISTMAFKLNGINFNPSILDGHCCVISPSSEVIYRAYLGMDVMQVSNAPNFLLNLV